MMKRIVAAECTDYQDYEGAKAYIEIFIWKIREKYTLIFLSGSCKGADMLGERYANENGFRLERYLVDWKKYEEMPAHNEIYKWQKPVVICFWDGKNHGTACMITLAKQFKKPLKW